MSTPAVPITPITQVRTAMSDAPNRATDEESVYSDKADVFADEITEIPPEENTLSSQMNVIADEINQNATISESNADDSQTSADDSAVSATASAAAANLVGNWADQTGAAAKPYGVAHDGKTWGLLNNLADVTTSEPGVTADWIETSVNLEYAGPLTGTAELVPKEPFTYDATGGSETKNFPSTLEQGDWYKLSVWDSVNPTTSLNTLTLGRNGHTLLDPDGGELDPSGDGNLRLCIGNFVEMVAISTTELKITDWSL